MLTDDNFTDSTDNSRDSKGRFLPGNKLAPGGKRDGSGPKKVPSTIISEARENDRKNLPLYFEKLSELALKGDREALFYLIDRHLGKAKMLSELELTGGEQIGAGTIKEIFKLIDNRKAEIESKRPSVIETASKSLTMPVNEGNTSP